MRKFLSFITLSFLMFVGGCSDEYDDSELREQLGNIEARMKKLETLCQSMNTNISSLQVIVNALQEHDYIKQVTPIIQEGKTLGYTISFGKNDPITILHGSKGDKGDKGENGQDGKPGENGQDGQDGKPGQDGQDGKPGQDGKDGYVPQIGIQKDIDGFYYWTIDGQWLKDENGKKICAQGTPGQDGKPGEDGQDGQDGKPGENGQDGQDGKPGQDGKDGITPKLKIENNKWYVSYDNGFSWAELGSAIGTAPVPTDPIFTDVQIRDSEVVFVTHDGSFTVPLFKAVGIQFKSTEEGIKAGATIRIPYTLTNATEKTVVSASSDGYYKVKLENKTLTGGVIVVTAPEQYVDGYINILLSDGNGYSTLHVISFYEWKMIFSSQEGILDGNQLIYSVPITGGVINIPLTVNFDYDLEISQETQTWLNTTVQSRAVVRNENIQLTVQPNHSTNAREGVIRVMPKNSTTPYIEIVVRQGDIAFSINKSNFFLNYNYQSLMMEIKCNANIDVEIPPTDKWITKALSASGSGVYKLRLDVASFTGSNFRSSKIPVYTHYGKNLLGTINIVQLAEGADHLKDMVLVYSVNKENKYTIELGVYNDEAINCIIQWGDGNTEHVKYDPKLNGNYKVIQHQYSIYQDKEFEVRISGSVSGVYGKASKALLSVKQWGHTGLASINFSDCINLKSIPNDDLGAFSNFVAVDNIFEGCTSLETIPENLFAYGNKIISLFNTFKNCTNLKSIPAGLFANCVNIEMFNDGIPLGDRGVFCGCKSLTSIPAKLFENCKKVKYFKGVFKFCENLTSVPAGLFDNFTEVINFDCTFQGCKNMSTVPAGLFANCNKVKTYNLIFDSCNLTSIPNNLFGRNNNPVEFIGSFSGNYNLKKIPEDLFQNCPNATLFASSFKLAGIEEIPEKLFSNNTKVTDFSDTFGGCEQLRHIPATLFDNNRAVTDFSNTFSFCKQLRHIPATLFDNNRVVTDFAGTFSGCSNLIGESPYTMINGNKVHLYERVNYPQDFANPTGEECFKFCSNLIDDLAIPIEWK